MPQDKTQYESKQPQIGSDEDAEKRKQEENFAKLDALGESLSKTRSEAIAARTTSGIEAIWLEDEEFYEGIDDANRATESRTGWSQKPPGKITAQVGSERSTVFPNIVGPFVDSAAARIADMLLPTDDRSWSLKPTPIPELSEIADEEIPLQMQQDIIAQNPDAPQQQDQAARQVVDRAQAEVEVAKKKANAAQRRIEDWHVECQWHAHIRQVIEDSARIGTGVLKGPVPQIKKRVTWIGKGVNKETNEEEAGHMDEVRTTQPGSKWVDPWNLYPDGACGDNIHNGNYIWERDFLTLRQLMELRKIEGNGEYIKGQIDQCIKEGPQKATAEYKESFGEADPAMARPSRIGVSARKIT